MYSTSTAFIGRQDTMSEIRRLLSAAVAGAGQCVVIEGHAGIGKSRLLQVMTREARILGMTAATCRATELDRVAPLSTLLSALQHGGLSGIDSTTLGGQGNDRFWLVDRVRELIVTHVRTRPLFIAVDDTQWADEFTMMALRTLVPELSTEPVFWLFALSPRAPLCPAASAIDWLVAEGAHRIELGPLCDSAVAELCTEMLGAEPDAAALALAARGSGNPFLLQRLFATLRDCGQLAIVAGSGTVLPGDLPACFLDAVGQRLQDLSADARGLLDAGAILNRPFTVHEAAGLLSRGTVDLLSIAKEAVQAGILTADGPELWFNHDLIREAVYSNLYEPIRMALHREAASIVKTEGRNPVEVSEHLIRCGGAPDAVRAQLTANRAHGLTYVGDSKGAEQAGAEAAMLAEITGEHSAMVLGNVARGVAAQDQGDIEAAIRWTRAAVETADQVDGEARLYHPRLWLARVLATADRFDEADAIYGMEQVETSLLRTAWSEPLWHCYRAELRLAQSLLAEAASEAEKGLRSAERLNALALSLPALALLIQVAVHRGDLAAAGRYADKVQRLTDTVGGTGPLQLLWPMALYQDALGEPGLALATMMPLIKVLTKRPVFAEAPMVGPALVKIAQRAGSQVSAEAVVSALQRLSQLNPAIPSMLGAAQHAVGLHTGDLEAFRAALRHFAASPRPLAQAAALEDAALAEYKAGHRRAAVTHLEEALSRYTTAGARHHIARAQQSLRGFGPRHEPAAGQPDTAGRLGLARLAGSPRLAEPAGHARLAQPDAPSYAQLTQSELPVAQLVTEGLTNREVAARLYISPHTVDSHLRHIFSKFGVNNRVELTRHFAPLADEPEATVPAWAAARRSA